MAKKALTLRWSREANANFLEILEHLSKESETAVQIVGNAILDETERLRYTPFMYAADPLKTEKTKTSDPLQFSITGYPITWIWILYISSESGIQAGNPYNTDASGTNICFPFHQP